MGEDLLFTACPKIQSTRSRKGAVRNQVKQKKEEFRPQLGDLWHLFPENALLPKDYKGSGGAWRYPWKRHIEGCYSHACISR